MAGWTGCHSVLGQGADQTERNTTETLESIKQEWRPSNTNKEPTQETQVAIAWKDAPPTPPTRIQELGVLRPKYRTLQRRTS